MTFENRSFGEFHIAGISIRTTNKGGQSQKDIGELWGRFMSDNIAHKISGKVNDKVYCIYTEYETDFMGEYTTILGFEVSKNANIPEGIVLKTIPASTYRVYKSM